MYVPLEQNGVIQLSPLLWAAIRFLHRHSVGTPENVVIRRKLLSRNFIRDKSTSAQKKKCLVTALLVCVPLLSSTIQITHSECAITL